MSSFNSAERNERATLAGKFRRHEKDTGSPEVQVALITKRLELLTSHAKKNKQDQHCERGMQRLISRRKRLLAYLKAEDAGRYKATIDTLGLRK